MSAAGQDTAIFQYDYPVCRTHGGNPLGYDDFGAVRVGLF